MATKVTVNLPDDTVEAIKKIAEQRGVTYTEAIRQAIESERFLREETQKGSKLLLEDGDSVRQIVLR